jgi:hypothetical protein
MNLKFFKKIISLLVILTSTHAYAENLESLFGIKIDDDAKNYINFPEKLGFPGTPGYGLSFETNGKNWDVDNPPRKNPTFKWYKIYVNPGLDGTWQDYLDIGELRELTDKTNTSFGHAGIALNEDYKKYLNNDIKVGQVHAGYYLYEDGWFYLSQIKEPNLEPNCLLNEAEALKKSLTEAFSLDKNKWYYPKIRAYHVKPNQLSDGDQIYEDINYLTANRLLKIRCTYQYRDEGLYGNKVIQGRDGKNYKITEPMFSTYVELMLGKYEGDGKKTKGEISSGDYIRNFFKGF